MLSYFEQLLQRPNRTPSRLSRFTEACGYLYMALGFSIFFFPGLQVSAGLIAPFKGQEEALFRLVGLAISFIGYFYVFGGRGQSKTFGLSTVLDRVLLPFFGFFLYQATHVDPMLILPLCILDPILGVTALLLWRRDESQLSPTP